MRQWLRKACSTLSVVVVLFLALWMLLFDLAVVGALLERGLFIEMRGSSLEPTVWTTLDFVFLATVYAVNFLLFCVAWRVLRWRRTVYGVYPRSPSILFPRKPADLDSQSRGAP